VRAVYRGQYDQAIQHLDLATAHGSQDPRVYFFRGLAKLRQGRSAEARFDFEEGARLEVQQGRKDIGRAIERIQGSERLVLEEYRRQARRTFQPVQQTTGKRRPASQVNSTAARKIPASPPSSPARIPVSEVPLQQRQLAADDSDPFAGTEAARLGHGAIVPASATARDDATEEAVENGGAADDLADADAAETATPSAFDDIEIDSPPERSDESTDTAAGVGSTGDAAPAGSSTTEPKPPKALGAALRAFGKLLPGAERRRRLLGNLPIPPLGQPSTAPPAAAPPAPPAAPANGNAPPSDPFGFDKETTTDGETEELPIGTGATPSETTPAPDTSSEELEELPDTVDPFTDDPQ
jgi:hypothetical protein